MNALQESLPQAHGATEQSRQKQTIAIAATFTAEPVAESLVFWMQELDLPSHIKFSPYNQVFQQLLDPASLLSKNQSGLNVLLTRFEDWERFDSSAEAAIGESSSPRTHERVEREVRDFIDAVRAAAERSATPHLVCLCPASSHVLADPTRLALCREMEELMAAQLDGVNGVSFVSSSEVVATYPVSAYYDPYGDEVGHVPYTPLFFTSLGTFIARKFYTIQSSPYKVIVLDCDQTLWKGVCGEDGAWGITLDPPRRALQEFMVAQYERGMLLCLSSKNNEEDVIEVFNCRPEMPLRRDHIVSWRINWGPKSENIKSLADELQLGLDSFIFIDDNPLEGAEVQANCPEVLTLLLPQDPQHIPEFLKHVWAFDREKITEEDKKRSALYQQNIQREHFRNESLSLEDFLAGLELEIQIAALMPAQLARVAQMTHRTNQFNCTTIRRSESALQKLFQSGLECLVAEVRDRFGDYGLVGVVMFQTEPEALCVDTFLLSCRAMGRGVEHRMLAQLGEIAQERGCAYVDVPYIPTKKNQPALNFLDAVGTQFKHSVSDGLLFKFPVHDAAALTLSSHTEENVGSYSSSETASGALVSNGSGTADRQAGSARLSRIATELYDAEQILKAVTAQKLQTRPELEVSFVAPQDALELQLTKMWEEILGRQPIGVWDDFFALGGDSLLAVHLFSQIEQHFGKKLPLATLFQAPTVQQLAEILRQEGWVPQWSSLVAIQPEGTKPPLFLVHAGEGQVLFYRDLVRYLGPEQPVYGLQTQGLHDGLPFHERIEDMAAHYITELRTVQPEGPYLLGGRCFGCLVALEMAQQLRAQGQGVGLLALMDPIVPPTMKSFRYRIRYCRNNLHHPFALLRHLGGLSSRWIARKAKKSLGHTCRHLSTLYPCSPLDQLAQTLLGSLPGSFPGRTAISRARRRYVPQVYPGRIVCFVDSERARLSPYPWPELTAGGVEWLSVPGHQKSMFQEPHVQGLAEKLRSCAGSAHAEDPHLVVEK